MYRIQKKLVPLMTNYLGVYSIRSRLSHSVKKVQILDQTIATPKACESVIVDEDPFPNSTRPYGRRLGAGTPVPVFVYGNVPLFSPLDTTYVPKDPAVLADRIAGTDSLAEPKRYGWLAGSLQHIFAMVRRYLLIKVRDINRLANLVYFPMADIIVAGLVSFWMARNNMNIVQEQTIYLIEIAIWIIINATHIESCFNFIEEIQTRNLVNLFSSSLHHGEWIIASLVLSSIEALLMTFVCGTFLYSFYGISLLTCFGWLLPLFVLLMIMAGWIMAITTISLMLHYGLRMTILTLALPYMIMTLSAAYYPLAALPTALQYLAAILPTTYIFEGFRALFMGKTVSTYHIVVCLILTALYAIGALIFYNYMFKKSMEQGLSRLESE